MMKTLAFATLFLLLLWAHPAASAQNISFPAPSITQLNNGLTVAVVHRTGAPLVAIDLWIRAGAREERPTEYGSAHFLEHMLFRGTTDRPEDQADIAIENLGATLDAETGPDALHIYTTVATVYFSQALEILGDVVQHASLPEKALEKERGIILDELARYNSDPFNRLIALLYAQAYPHMPYDHPPGGTPDTISIRARDTLMAFYDRCCTPKRSLLVIVGDINPQTALAEVKMAFEAWQPTPSSQTSITQPADAQAPILAPYQMNVMQDSSSQWTVGIAFRAPRAAHCLAAATGYLTANLLKAFLANRPDTPSLHIHFVPRLDPSLYIISFQAPSMEAAMREEKEIIQAISALRTSPPPMDLFLEARQRTLGQLEFQTETDLGLAKTIGQALITQGDLPNNLATHLLQLAPQDVQKFCMHYFSPDQCLALALTPKSDLSANKNP